MLHQRRNSCGCSEWSSYVTFSTSTDPPSWPLGSTLQLAAQSGTSLTIRWPSAASLRAPVTKYLLDFKRNVSSSKVTFKRAYAGLVPAAAAFEIVLAIFLAGLCSVNS